jgi:hypothetical protein
VVKTKKPAAIAPAIGNPTSPTNAIKSICALLLLYMYLSAKYDYGTVTLVAH